MIETVTIPKARFAAIIRKFGKPIKTNFGTSDGYILSVPLDECGSVGNFEIIPADGADGVAISYVAYERGV